jgi:NAD+ diphosphatase
MYSALAGFVEAGESLEQCMHREVAEEVGVQVDEPALLRQPELAVPAQPDDRLHRALDRRRHRAAGRRDRGRRSGSRLDALPNIPPRFSIAGHLIRDTLAAMPGGHRPGATVRATPPWSTAMRWKATCRRATCCAC